MQQIQELEITHLPIGDLRPDPANPRRISDEELESLTRSIREFGSSTQSSPGGRTRW